MTVLAELARSTGRPVNDPEVVSAASAASAWARRTLGWPADVDDLDEQLAALDADHLAAIVGYGRDVLRAGKTTAGYGDGAEPAALSIFDRRWSAMLRFGRGPAGFA